MDFGNSVDNWRNRELRSRAPKFKKKKATRTKTVTRPTIDTIHTKNHWTRA